MVVAMGPEQATICARDFEIAEVLLIDEDPEIAGLAEIAAGSIAMGLGGYLAVQGDMANEDDILRLFAETDRAFGALTGLVNNAGGIGGQKRRIDAITYASVMEVMRLNVAGPLLCARG